MENELKPVEDSDMDSMFILPLTLIPLETPALRSARLIKNVKLVSVIEIFRDSKTGSGQVDVESLPVMFNWKPGAPHPDLAVLRRLVLLPSYDVYSLRISLREHGIKVNDFDALRLTPEKMEQLTKYMVMFTRPLLNLIYADETVQIEKYEDIIRLFRDPDIKKARERLDAMAKTLGVPIMEVPRFLEDFGDTFMCLSYYRHCLDRLEPYFAACLEALIEIRKHFQLRKDNNLMRTCDTIEDVVNSVSAGISGRLEVFDRRTQQMWGKISQEEFREVKEMVERYHITIGAALCGLTVKMNAFGKMFPHAKAGGPVRRADFMVAEMVQGIELIRSTERL